MNYKKTILHVDDDPEVTSLVEDYLRPLGYEVTGLNDPARVMDILCSSQYRLVILDIDMPKVNGLHLLREIKHTFGDIQVIMLTGLVSIQTLMQSYRWGADSCVFKPITDSGPLRDAVSLAFAKIDRWWNALEELRKQRHAIKLSAQLCDLVKSYDDLDKDAPISTDF